MTFFSDFTKAPEQILCDLINNVNGCALTPTVVTFSNVGPNQAPSPSTTDQVTIAAVANSGYSGSLTLQYNRVSMAKIPGAKSTTFPQGSATKISDLIAQINAQFGINLTAADYVDGPLPSFHNSPHETQPFTIQAASGSLIWTGSLALTLSANDVSLSNVITNAILAGLNYQPPV